MSKVNQGDNYGRLTIIREAERRNKKKYFLCECECGSEKEVRMDSLRDGSIISCGCYNKEVSKEANTKHGMYQSRIYRIWSAMKGRCLNPNNDSYKNYGGRGITVCDEWKSDFDAFAKWAKKSGYKDYLTIERKNVNGNYSPSNCTWATLDEQKRNTTVSKKINFKGKQLTLRQWAEEIGVASSTLSNRFKRGWSIEKSLTTPSQKKFIGRSKKNV